MTDITSVLKTVANNQAADQEVTTITLSLSEGHALASFFAGREGSIYGTRFAIKARECGMGPITQVTDLVTGETVDVTDYGIM